MHVASGARNLHVLPAPRLIGDGVGEGLVGVLPDPYILKPFTLLPQVFPPTRRV